MTAKIFPPRIAEFVAEHWPSDSHRRMFILGQVLTKLSAMFQLAHNEPVPDEATAAFILLLEGMESGNEAEYRSCDELAMKLYQQWLARRELN